MARELGALCVLVAACSGAEDRAPQAASADTSPAAPVFRVHVTPPPSCARAQPCEARIVLTALDPYKVNEEYPFKFVADPDPQLAFDGTGAFDPKSATHTITFRADAKGIVKVSGTFKLSVCTDATCKIEAPKVAFEVAIRD